MISAQTKILIVDDMLMMRKTIAKLCREVGFSNITEASNGIEAWNEIRIASPPFDLIISDWNMPEGTGMELLKQVRGEKRLSATPIIMVTSEKEKEQIEQMIKAGATDYIPKPFSRESFREKLQSLIGNLAWRSMPPKTKIKQAK